MSDLQIAQELKRLRHYIDRDDVAVMLRLIALVEGFRGWSPRQRVFAFQLLAQAKAEASS